MPLGASITYGQESSDGNGYRARLKTLLEEDDYPVRFVGSRHNGTMSDNASEGWEGRRIDEVFDKARESVSDLLPNLVLINAGANDCFQRDDFGEPENAGETMRELLGFLWKESPDATLVLSTLIVNGIEEDDDCLEEINEKFESLAEEQRERGKKVVLADMRGKGAPTLKDMADFTHPNDEGYEKMADIWYEAIQEAAAEGWLEEPQKPGDVDNGSDNGSGGSNGGDSGAGNGSDNTDSDSNDDSNGESEDTESDNEDEIEDAPSQDESDSEDDESAAASSQPWFFSVLGLVVLATAGVTA